MNVGIDLGTTNSALAFIDAKPDETEFPPIHVLDVPQFVAQGTVEARRTLPSFLFLGDREYVGIYAREQGALVPTKSVHSAKSWLSNSEVDRTAKILPWDAQEGGRVFSPVEVSTRVLSTLATAFHEKMGVPLGAQQIVLTVPASFDEEARSLTVEAAKQAGLESITLVEEPAAAFYSWIANDLARSQKLLFDGQTILICDVGGGTSDFTLIKVGRTGDKVEFTRTAVGKHLLLGGDNLDLTLAWLVEQKLGKPLSIRQRSGLRRQCASAKERLLADESLASVDITVLGAGSSLIGGTLRTNLTREEVLELAVEGFTPFCGKDDRPVKDEQSPFRELGLPYETDAAITRHLAAFLGDAGAAPDAILFNGGFFIPDILRQRVASVVESWTGKHPAILENRDLDLAVAVGAAYYSYVRSTGAGLLVRGGLPRAYFIGAGEAPEAIRTLCLMPRGSEEGSSIELDRDDLQLVANKAVSFRLYSSLTRTEDQLGDVVEFPRSAIGTDLHVHAPLEAVLRFGKSGERLVPAKLGARLTEVGTLEVWADSKVSEHRFKLEFALRKKANAVAAMQRPVAMVSDSALEAALALVAETFGAGTLPPTELPGRLEATLTIGRGAWPLSAMRALADKMLELSEGRKRGAAHELRWLNLCGFCLRPGFGFPGDELRIELARRVYAGGLTFANQVQNEIEWWIFWGRVAGGLNKNQQGDVYQRLSGSLLPKGNKRPRLNASLEREMWRAGSGLELLPAQVRTQLGDELIARLKKNDFVETSLWCLARLGARSLFYGPANQVLPASTAARWVDAVLKHDKRGEFVLALARQTGDSARDLPAASIDAVRRTFPDLNLASDARGDLAAMGRIFGEELPSGLVFGAS